MLFIYAVIGPIASFSVKCDIFGLKIDNPPTLELSHAGASERSASSRTLASIKMVVVPLAFNFAT